MKADDFQIGQYVAVIDYKGQFDARENFSGIPLRIIAVSLPFIAVETPDGSLDTIDTRVWEMGRLTKKYACLVINAILAKTAVDVLDTPTQSDDGHKRCVRCGERMVQLFCNDNLWHWHCNACGMTGEPVTA